MHALRLRVLCSAEATHSIADAEPPLPPLSHSPSDAHGTTHFANVPHAKYTRARTPRPYDGSETDAWELGVALFALATCVLPFNPSFMLDAPPADVDAQRARRRWVLRVVRRVDLAYSRR